MDMKTPKFVTNYLLLGDKGILGTNNAEPSQVISDLWGENVNTQHIFRRSSSKPLLHLIFLLC